MWGPGLVARLVEHCPVHQEVAGLIPGQGAHGKQPINVSLSHQCFSLSLSQINKQIFERELKGKKMWEKPFM